MEKNAATQKVEVQNNNAVAEMVETKQNKETTEKLETEKKTRYQEVVEERNKKINSFIEEKKEELLKCFDEAVDKILSLILNDMDHKKILVYANAVKNDKNKLCPWNLELFILYGDTIAQYFSGNIPPYGTIDSIQLFYEKLNAEGIPFEERNPVGDVFFNSYKYYENYVTSPILKIKVKEDLYYKVWIDPDRHNGGLVEIIY